MVRSAIVQDWFFTPGGSERVADELATLLPGAPIHTSFADAPSIRRYGDRLRTWPLQRLLPGTRAYRRFLPMYPLWFGHLNLLDADVVVSSSSAFAKAVRTRPTAIHVAYIHTPMRYAWDVEGYLAGSSVSPVTALAARTIRPWLQRWDRAAAQRPTALVANSEIVKERIRRYWGRDATVVHPPVDVDEIELSTQDDGFLLVAARMLAYRRLDLAVAAASSLGRQLVVVGDGPERRRLEAMASSTVRFAGTLDRPTLLDLFARCHAYVVPGVEDFGIAPVEAMAAGKPVIAFGQGGAAETVVDGSTGVLVQQQSVEAFADAIDDLDNRSFDPSVIRARADQFSTRVFRRRMREILLANGAPKELLATEADEND